MRRRTLLALALGLGAIAPGTVRAQYVMDIGHLMLAIQADDLWDEVEPIYEATTVYVTRVTSLAAIRINSDRLSRLIARRERDLRRFRRAIRGARRAMQALEVHGHSLDQVIWATHSGGASMLYVDNR